MPAAAVIPAPIAYTNVVAVKKLVVGFQIWYVFLQRISSHFFFDRRLPCIHLLGCSTVSFTLRKLECSKQVFCLNITLGIII